MLLGRVQSGWTPLHTAAFNGNASVCTLLIERGADVSNKTKVRRESIVAAGGASLTILGVRRMETRR